MIAVILPPVIRNGCLTAIAPPCEWTLLIGNGNLQGRSHRLHG